MSRLSRRGVIGAGGQLVGGVAIGSPGGTGTIYEGYTLSWGDEFNSLDIITPANGLGRYFTTRTYLPGARGSDTLLGTMYDTDPYHTGYNDSNRGNAYGYNNMYVSNSAVTLQARNATTQERAHFQGTGRLQVGAMLSGAGAVGFYPSTADTGDVIIEWRAKWTPKAGNPAGWHPTLWTQSVTPTPAIDSDEHDIEGNSQFPTVHRNVWTGGTAVIQTYDPTVLDIFDGTYRTCTMIMNKTNLRVYIDGTLVVTGAYDTNTKNKLTSFLITSHVFNGNFGEDYSQAAWDADADGAAMTVDWVRVWRRSAQAHYKPLATVANQNIDMGGSVAIVIPSALTLWGDAGVTEYLQSVMTEENEPGAAHSSVYTQFPTGVSYNAGTRTLTVAPTSTKAGRLNFVMHAYKTTGTTCEPLRFCVNVGPRINVTSMSFSVGASVSYDLYAQCDCGQLVSDSSGVRAKTISVTGLTGSGLSYNDATGLITGTATAFSGSITVTVTNSVGQSKSASVTLSVASGSFVNDTFTDTSGTLLTAHTGETGATWAKNSASGTTNDLTISTTGTIFSGFASGLPAIVLYASGSPPSADYYVEGVVNIKTLRAGDQVGITGRSLTNAVTFYMARYHYTSGAVQLYKAVSGTLTQLGSNYSVSWANGESHTIRLTMTGTTISVDVDGSVGVISVTDSAVTAAGVAGVRIYNDTAANSTAGVHLSSITAAV